MISLITGATGFIGSAVVRALLEAGETPRVLARPESELRGGAGVDPNDALLVVPLLVWTGLSDWLLAAACLGAPAFAVFVAVKFRSDLHKPES